MRSFFIISLFILFFTKTSAQHPNLPGGYFTTYAGAGPLANGGLLVGLNLSGGYQLNQWLGVGGSFGAQIGMSYFASSYSGLSLQYRMRPADRLVLSFDYGYILGHQQGFDSCSLDYIPGWYPFYKIHGGWKLGSLFTLGVGVTGLPEVKYEEAFNFNSTTGLCENISVSSYEWTASGVMLTLGLTLR